MKKITSIVMCSIIAIVAGLPMASVWAGDSYWGSADGNFSTAGSWQSSGHARAPVQLAFDNIKIRMEK